MMCQTKMKHASVIVNEDLRHIIRNVLPAVAGCCRLLHLFFLQQKKTPLSPENTVKLAFVLNSIKLLPIVAD